MIAYKVFRVMANKLYPFYISDKFEAYSKKFIHTRADGCGPFTCFKTYRQADDFKSMFKFWGENHVIYKVKIEESKEKTIWVKRDDKKPVMLWYPKTILADEFEILRKMKT